MNRETLFGTWVGFLVFTAQTRAKGQRVQKDSLLGEVQ